jgi:predicted dehydrogenase
MHDRSVGGGRIIGEVCHFIDLASYICGSSIKYISAKSMDDASGNKDTVVIQLKCENGSIASVTYFANGSREMAKEYLEVFNMGRVFVSDDFTGLFHYGKTMKKIMSGNQDKGHGAEVAAFVNSIKNGMPSPIPFSELYNSTAATFKVLESIAQNGRDIEV